MRSLGIGSLLLVSLCSVLLAEEPKTEPTIAQLQAEVESLKSQLAQLQMARAFDMKMCQASVQAAREFIMGTQQPQPGRPAVSTNRPQSSQGAQSSQSKPETGSQTKEKK
jgi:hypothetical protein